MLGYPGTANEPQVDLRVEQICLSEERSGGAGSLEL